MRSVWVLISLVAPAAGDPVADSAAHPERPAESAGAGDPRPRVLQLKPPTFSGHVIVPDPHPDAAPWPRGMVITPPDVGDPMVVNPNALGLGGTTPLDWLRAGFDGVRRALGAF
ncbi:MAG: hypothetical protein AB7O24_10990 [Kofleriaceae bacterium]